MSIKTTINYSLNFNIKKRKKNDIKFLIYHYTGMKHEKASINRLLGIQSKVSAHYLIKNNGKIISMVPDLYSAWHAGISEWKKNKRINQKSIGIEISNPGHQHGYVKFKKKQINSLIRISLYLIKKYNIKKFQGNNSPGSFFRFRPFRYRPRKKKRSRRIISLEIIK